MTTATALRHVENALRSRLGIRAPHARRIVDRRPLNSGLDELGHDVRGCIAVVGDLGGGCRGVSLYRPDADGALRRFGELDLLPEDLVRFDAMPIEQAYAMPDGLFLPETSEASFGDDANAPEMYEWVLGSIGSIRIQDGHLRVIARIGDEETECAMIPWFGTAGDLADNLSGKVGIPARLCITRNSSDWKEMCFPADMTVIDMVFPEQDVDAIREALGEPTSEPVESDIRIAA